MRSHDFQCDDLGTFSDTDILVHIPLHVHQPLHQPSVAAAVVGHYLQAGLVPAVLCWVHALVLQGHCLGHHHLHGLLVLHAKQVEYNTL